MSCQKHQIAPASPLQMTIQSCLCFNPKRYDAFRTCFLPWEDESVLPGPALKGHAADVSVPEASIDAEENHCEERLPSGLEE